MRQQAIDLVTGEHIGGVAGAVVRRGEQIDFTHTAALQTWRENGKWYADEDEQSLASAFQFGVAACTQPTVVLEKSGSGFLNTSQSDALLRDA